MKSVTLGQLLAMLSLGVFSFGFQVHAKEYYKWVDAKGVTTYSATPQPVQRHEPQLDPAKKTINPTTTNPSIPASGQNVAVNSKTTASIQTKPIAATTEGNNTLKASSEMLFSIKSCNGVRCWDMKGQSYHLVAGTTYLSAKGGKCQKIANQMHCNK